jgi:hypothetical protein
MFSRCARQIAVQHHSGMHRWLKPHISVLCKHTPFALFTNCSAAIGLRVVPTSLGTGWVGTPGGREDMQACLSPACPPWVPPPTPPLATHR